MEKDSYPQVVWHGQGALLTHAAAQGKKKPWLRRISSDLSAQSSVGRRGASPSMSASSPAGLG